MLSEVDANGRGGDDDGDDGNPAGSGRAGGAPVAGLTL